MRFQVIDPISKKTVEKDLQAGIESQETLYLSPPWIDSHCHVFHGVNFGILPDDIGYKTGVHLLVDAGSAGVETLKAFSQYVVAPAKTKVLAFLNISAIGLVTMQEYHDLRQARVQDAARAVQENPTLLAGIKARSSGYVVGDQGLMPFHRAIEAAEIANCPVMVHMGEAPPTNAENLPLFRKGDILTHCFHGKQAPKWNAQPLWNPDGTPIPEMRAALDRGMLLDVGHGEASFSAEVAAPVIARGEYEFSISTDLHGRSWHDPVHSLSVTMSKFLALGMTLEAVIRAVTAIPAARLGLTSWCDSPEQNGTVFRLRDVLPTDAPFVDSRREPIAVRKVIEPVAVIMDGEWIEV